MEKLNNKIKNGRSEKIDDAQMVGNYAYDTTIDKLRRLTCDTNGALHVDVHGGSSGSGDLKCRTDIADPATSTFVKCNADGTLEMTAELSSAGLATSVIQTDGTQKARCMGGETDGTQRQLLTSNLGVLQVLDSEVFGKTSQIANQTTLSNTNEATIIANQTNGTQKATVGNTVGDGSGTAKHLKTNADGELLVNLGTATTQNVNCLGNTVGDGSGTATHLKTSSDGSIHVVVENSDNVLIKGIQDGTTTQKDAKTNANGDLRVQLIANDNNDGTGTNRIVGCNSNGFLKVKDDELETNFVGGLFSTQMMGRTTITDTATRKNLLCDADGHLQVDIVSGGGGGSTPATTAVVLTSTSTAISAGATQDFKTGTTGFTQFNVAGVRELSYIIEGSGTSPSLTATELVGAVTGVLVPVAGLGGGSSTANFAFASSISAQHRGIQIKNNSVGDSYTVTKITAVYTT